MKLNWRLFHNPVYLSASPLYLDLGKFQFTQAQFSTFAQGGFGDGVLAFANPSDAEVREAANHWLMKRVVATDGAGRIAYEGFVAEVSAQSDKHKYWRSMDGFANSELIWFQYKGHPGGLAKCPKGSLCRGLMTRSESDVATTTTQTDLGIKESWLDLTQEGRLRLSDAQAQADTKLLEELAARSVDIELGGTKNPNSITLTLWGYYSTLLWRHQTLAVKTVTDVATIVKNALTTGSAAQFINLTDFSQMPATGKTLVFNVDTRTIEIQKYIQQAIELASPNNRTMFFQIWENRRAFLTSRSTLPTYFSRSDDNRMFNAARGVIPNYMVRAGSYVAAENADVSIDYFTDVLGRNFMSFVDTTTYDDIADKLHIPPPQALKLNVAQRLAKGKK